MKSTSLRFYYFAIFFLVLVFAFCVLGSAKAQSASVYLAPYNGTFLVGSTFNVSIFVNTEGNSINAVELNLKFPPSLLQVTSPTAGSSFISVWANQPSYSNTDGTLNFAGGVPGTGINTSAGLVSTITFRAKATGKAVISILGSSKVLLSDGKGTNILKDISGAQYDLTLQPPEGPQVYSPTHPSQDAWYKNNDPVFVISKDIGVSDFSYSFDQDPQGFPDNTPNTSSTQVTIDNAADGIWYFHVKAQKDGIWGGVTSYAVRIDNTPPENFKVNIDTVGPAGAARSFAYFSTNDLLSGVDHYEVSVVDMTNPQEVANPFFVEASSPYQLPISKSGRYEIFVRAFDKAGNFTQSQTTLRTIGSLFSYTNSGIKIKNFLLPFWLAWLIVLVILSALGFLFYRILRSRNLSGRLKTEVAEAEKEIEDVRKLEKRIHSMRNLEDEARLQSERLAEKLTKDDDENPEA